MKKLLVLMLAVAFALSLTACGGTNIEKFCDGYSIFWDNYEGQHNDEIHYYALFEDGVLTIEQRKLQPFSASTTGTAYLVEETETYNYELEGNDTIIIDGETYTYEISDNRVEFNKDLMGISSWWKR